MRTAFSCELEAKEAEGRSSFSLRVRPLFGNLVGTLYSCTFHVAKSCISPHWKMLR